jgi:hypothetical protein
MKRMLYYYVDAAHITFSEKTPNHLAVAPHILQLYNNQAEKVSQRDRDFQRLHASLQSRRG